MVEFISFQHFHPTSSSKFALSGGRGRVVVGPTTPDQCGQNTADTYHHYLFIMKMSWGEGGRGGGGGEKGENGLVYNCLRMRQNVPKILVRRKFATYVIQLTVHSTIMRRRGGMIY